MRGKGGVACAGCQNGFNALVFMKDGFTQSQYHMDNMYLVRGEWVRGKGKGVML